LNLRELFIQWLTASRFIQSLETRIAEQRNDFQERLGEKDAQIRLLRTEVATLKLECDRMRSVLLPFASPSGAAYAQRFDASPQKPPQVPALAAPDDWQAELNKMLEEEQSGLRSERREKEHQPSADDGAQSQP
jgi:hypothetical protein